MVVRIVTDSTADLPSELSQELGITVVPAYLRFGDSVYRDRVDISEDEFYRRLENDPVHPMTEPPTPQDFADVYERLSREAEGIVSLHISSKLSATYGSAMRGRELLEGDCPVDVIDTQLVTMGLGLLTIVAASAARRGASVPQIGEEVRRTIPNIRMLGIFDTLKYLTRGGRIGTAKSLLGSLLNVKPMLTMRDGEVEPAGQVRQRANGIERLFEFVSNAPRIQDLAIVYSTSFDEAQMLADRVDAVFGKESIRLARLGPVLGVHGGPGMLLVALRVKSE